MKLKNYLNLLYPLIALAVFFAVWLIAAEIIKIEVILPHPAQAFKQLLLLVKPMDFWTAIGHTLLRTFISFFISMSLALLLAALSS